MAVHWVHARFLNGFKVNIYPPIEKEAQNGSGLLESVLKWKFKILKSVELRKRRVLVRENSFLQKAFLSDSRLQSMGFTLISSSKFLQFSDSYLVIITDGQHMSAIGAEGS